MPVRGFRVVGVDEEMDSCDHGGQEPQLFPDHYVANRDTVETSRGRVGRSGGLDLSFLIRRPHRDDDLVGRKVASASRIARSTSASPALASIVSPERWAATSSATCSAWVNAFWSFASQSKTPCRTTGTTTFSLSTFTEVSPQHVFWMIDGTDDEDVSHSTGSMPASEQPRNLRLEGDHPRRRLLGPTSA